MITKLLSTAIKLYLRSQVSRVKDLQVRIGGKNRHILKGYIPEVFLSCQEGIYQGLHLREVKVSGKDIAFNLAEVLKKKPLRLLEPIVVRVELTLSGDELSASIDSDLLQSGLTDLWQIISDTNKVDSSISGLHNLRISWENIAITKERLNIAGSYQDSNSKNNNLTFSAGVSLANSHTLKLYPLKVVGETNVIESLQEELLIDLGNDVEMERLFIEEEQLFCLGNITVNS